ncbi:MAG TPA: PAS domain-containing sensor histidine kinase, partial [Gemmatimonas sp.]|nr:PAS domain-containing sensor histidine kinase [Gemmatimonas sp.]
PVVSPVDTGALARVYLTVHEVSPDGFTLFEPVRDGGGRIVDFVYAYVNPAGASMVGRTPQELIGQRMCMLFPSVVELGVFDGYAATCETGMPWQYEMHYDRDGIDCGFRLVAVRTTSGNGSGGAVAVQYADISARLLAERERDALLLRAAQLQRVTAALAAAASEQDVATLVAEHVTEMVGARHVSILVATDPDAPLRFLAVNRFPQHLVAMVEEIPRSRGWPAAEAFRTGQPVIVSSLAEMLARFPAVVDVATQLGVSATVSLPLRVNDTVLGVMPVDFATAGVPDADRLSLLTEIAAQCAVALERLRLQARDVAARTKLEAALATVARLSHEKSAFLAEVSHEVRTPLQSIASYSELLTHGAMGALTDAQQDALRRIEIGTDRIRHLIDDVLEFAQLEGGHVALAADVIDVAEAVRTAESLLTARRMDAGLTFALAVETSDPVLAVADARRLQQIVLNVLTNAIKYTPRDGHISVSVSRSVVPPAADTIAPEIDGWITVAVRDTGPGIPADQFDAVFQPFMQLERARAQGRGAQDGVGLGLPISRELARRMGGDLTVASTVGEGATFTLTLPAAV